MFGLRPPFVHFVATSLIPHCVGPKRSIAHRRGGWVVLRPRGPRSGSSYAVSDRHHLIDPIRPTRERIAISPHGGLYAMPSLCGSAEATRGWFRAFATIPSWHAALYGPRGARSSLVQNFDADIAFAEFRAARHSQSSRNPFHAGHIFRGFPIHAFATACQVARPPIRIRPIHSAPEGFYFQASNGSVALPVAGYDYNSDWTPLLAGLSPAGMAASLAARRVGSRRGSGFDDADVSSIPPIIPYGGFSPIRLQG